METDRSRLVEVKREFHPMVESDYCGVRRQKHKTRLAHCAVRCLSLRDPRTLRLYIFRLCRQRRISYALEAAVNFGTSDGAIFYGNSGGCAKVSGNRFYQTAGKLLTSYPSSERLLSHSAVNRKCRYWSLKYWRFVKFRNFHGLHLTPSC